MVVRAVLTVDEAVTFFRAVPQVYEPLLTLAEVGLGYIRLGQSATTLSSGEAGGQIVAQGPPETVARSLASHTGQYLAKVLAGPAG